MQVQDYVQFGGSGLCHALCHGDFVVAAWVGAHVFSWLVASLDTPNNDITESALVDAANVQPGCFVQRQTHSVDAPALDHLPVGCWSAGVTSPRIGWIPALDRNPLEASDVDSAQLHGNPMG